MVSVRSLRPEDFARPRPIYCVWEITLRCDHECAHCGSRAGPVRDDELSTEEMFEVADHLVRLGTREVTLIGGEAYLRSDSYRLVEHLAKQHVRVTMQTGGRGLTLERAKKFKDCGLAAVGVSVDGPADVHDVLRASPGSHEAAMRAIANCREAGIPVTSNSQINRLNADRLVETGRMLEDAGVIVWRAQLTAPMGRAADHPEWILQPYMILDVIETLANIQRDALERARERGIPMRRAFNVALGNNLGYYGPHEQILRSRPGREDRHWQGCKAGQFVMGIESDGTVKGCPSLPTAPYTGGNVRELSLDRIWDAEQIAFTRDRGTSELWGFCKSCYYADTCRAGCSFTAHSTLGRRGNMPFCWHRANTLRKQGVREVLVPSHAAPGEPYDFGRFALREEPWSTEPPPIERATTKLRVLQ